MIKLDQESITELINHPKFIEALSEVTRANESDKVPREVTTSTGHVWIKDGDRWLDTATGLYWDDKSRGKYTHEEASNNFSDNNTINERLPTKHEWLEAYAHGIVEVIPAIIGEKYWTASVYSNYRGYAWSFYSNVNGIVEVYTNDRDNVFGVRCVGR